MDSYIIRPLVLDDLDQLKELTVNAYYPDTEFCQAFELDQQDLREFVDSIDFEGYVQDQYSLGVFYKQILVCSILSKDIRLCVSEKLIKNRKVIAAVDCILSVTQGFQIERQFQKGQCIYFDFLLTHREHRQKGLAGSLFKYCVKMWKENGFRTILCEAVHVVTKKLILSLESKGQYILDTVTQVEGKPFWIQGLAIDLE